MRRKDREIVDFNRMEDILKKCLVCRVALHDGDYPYIVPLSPGYTREGDAFSLYFHCAREGKKLDLMRANPCVAFEMDCDYVLIPAERACGYTAHYQSLTGRGILTEVAGSEAVQGLSAIMRAHERTKTFEITETMLQSVCILKLSIGEMTAKASQ